MKWFETPEGRESLHRANRETAARINEVTEKLAEVFAAAAADAAGITVDPNTDPVDEIQIH